MLSVFKKFFHNQPNLILKLTEFPQFIKTSKDNHDLTHHSLKHFRAVKMVF